jgi:hypothetical protein
METHFYHTLELRLSEMESELAALRAACQAESASKLVL